MKSSSLDIQEFLQCTDEDEDDVFLNFIVSGATTGAELGRKSPSSESDSRISTSFQPAADRERRENAIPKSTPERSSSSEARGSSSGREGCSSVSSMLFNEYEMQSDHFDQADEAYLNAYIENAEKICKEYTELTACEAKVIDFETEIVVFQRKLDVTGEMILMQEQIEEVLRRKGNRNQVSDSLNEVYSALQEVDSFCEWIVKNHTHQKVDEVYLSYLHRLGVKLTFLSRHKALHHSAVDDEIRPKLTAAAELAGEKILGYIASRIQRVQWEASPPASCSSSPTIRPLSERRFSDMDGEGHRESSSGPRAASMPGSRNHRPLDGVGDASTSSLSLGSASLSALPARAPTSPQLKSSSERGIGERSAHPSHSSSFWTMAALHESLEQGEHFGMSFLKLYNPPVAKRIVLLYLQQGATYYQQCFSAALQELVQCSSVYRQNSSGHSQYTDGTRHSQRTGNAAPSTTTGPSSSHSQVPHPNTPAGNARSSPKDTKKEEEESGALGKPTSRSDRPLEAKKNMERVSVGKRKDGKDTLFVSSSFLYDAPASRLLEEVEEWRKQWTLCTTRLPSTDTFSVATGTSDAHASVSADMGAEWNVVEYLCVLNAMHFKYGALHFTPPQREEMRQMGIAEKKRGPSLPCASGTTTTTTAAAPSVLWLSHFISVLLLFVNTCTEECRFIANFFCLAETTDGAVENYNDAEKIAKLLLEPLLDRFQPLLHSCLPQAPSAMPGTSLSSGVKRQYVMDSLAAIRVLELCKGHLSASQDPIPLLLLSGMLESCRGLLRSSLSSLLTAEVEGLSQEVWSVLSSPVLVSPKEEKEEKEKEEEEVRMEGGVRMHHAQVAIPPVVISLLRSIWVLDTLNTVPLRASTFHMDEPPVSEKEVDRSCVAVSHLLMALFFRVAGVETSAMPTGEDGEPKMERTNPTGMGVVPAKVTTSSAASAHFLLLSLHAAWYCLRVRMESSSAAWVVLPDTKCGGGTTLCWREAVQQSLALQPWLYTKAPHMAHVSQWWWTWKANALASMWGNEASRTRTTTTTPPPSAFSAMPGVSHPPAGGASALSCRTLGACAVTVPSCTLLHRPTDMTSGGKQGRGIPLPVMPLTGIRARKAPVALSPHDRQALENVLGPLLRGEIEWKAELHEVWTSLCGISAPLNAAMTGEGDPSGGPCVPSMGSSLAVFPVEMMALLVQEVWLPLLQTLPPTGRSGRTDTPPRGHRSSSRSTHQDEAREKRRERRSPAAPAIGIAATPVGDTNTLEEEEEGNAHGGKNDLAASSSAMDGTAPRRSSKTENEVATRTNDRNEDGSRGEEGGETVLPTGEPFTALSVERFLEACVEEDKKLKSSVKVQKTNKTKKKVEIAPPESHTATT